MYSQESGYRHFFGHMYKVFSEFGRLSVLKTRPDQSDSEITVNSSISQRLIYGSPKTVLAELIKLRQNCGPFGTLLITGSTGPGRMRHGNANR